MCVFFLYHFVSKRDPGFVLKADEAATLLKLSQVWVWSVPEWDAYWLELHNRRKARYTLNEQN